jgi:phosphoadenosine phosphosulfate reductase
VTVLNSPADVEHLHPAEVLRWAFDTHGVENVAVTSSFEDAVLAHLALSVDPRADVVLLDTQYLFAETLWYARRLAAKLGLNLVVREPDVQPDDL